MKKKKNLKLITSKETSYEEMQAFFHRSILCKYNTLFVVEINGSFSNYQQRCMNIFIDKLLTYKNKIFNEKNIDKEMIDKSNTFLYMESCLVFIYNKKCESFVNELKNYNPKELQMNNPFHSLIRNNPNESRGSIISIYDPLREKLFEKTHIIQSEICGLGKSTQIKNKIKKSGKKYIYFPLGGNITKDIIYNKLYKIMEDIKTKTDNKYEDIAIHLDLFDSKDNIVSVLNEFLFSFLITKFYSNNENVIYIPINIEIYIEIPNSFKDFISNYGILKSFKRDEDIITFENLPELELADDKLKLFKNMLGMNDNKEIYKWLKEKIKLKRYSYHQIHIFINLFICQYNIFKGQKIFFRDNNNDDVTGKCIDSFAEATKYFTYGGFSRLLLKKKNEQETKIDEIEILSKQYENDLQNEKFNEKLIFIVKNKNGKFGDCLGIYYNLGISSDALKKGEALGKEEKERRKKKEKNQNEKELPSEYIEKLEYLYVFKKILDLENPVKPDEKNEKNLISLLEIIEKDDYIITIDNFRKMILILYRIIANIPVILMGETGCGKTALIKKLNQLLNNGEEKLEQINIDPSYDDEKLTKKMDEINEKAKKGKKELWVFFDELNTCDSLSLITEIFINRTYGRKELSKNIRLIGACNPYRKKREDKNICGLTYQNDNEVQLVYLVNILPQSLMYYVFNFGSLEKKNEDQYISSIISDIIPDKKLKEATKNVISQCHDYLRKTFDPSVVSLREMRRFKKIYHFLIEYFNNKKKLDKTKSGTEESTKLKSIIISIYLCYYIRLVDGTSRTNFDPELEDNFKKLVNYKSTSSENANNTTNKDVIDDGDLKDDLKSNYNISDFNQFHFSHILSCEEDFILNNINLNKGIGKNKSLKENIFLLFTALVTNIPLIIIGKPGSSKSLSAQLIYKEMGGKYSRNKFFKLYPSIIQSYFQGADTTTPGEVDGIFEIAEGRLKALKNNKNNEKVDLPISMILFDELGLAERSKYNPLKALHSHLELDGNKHGTSFIGISNWTLDAAKINRALTLSVPDLDSDLDGLKTTSVSIAESINDTFGTRPIFNKILPNVYLHFKENLKILKQLTVYKQYELQKYKDIINKYKKDKDFEKIFSDIEECKSFFYKEEKKTDKQENKKNEQKIFEYDIFDKVKTKLKKFLEEKNEENNALFDPAPFSNKDFKKLYENDKKIKEDFLGNRDFYFIIKGIANEMNEINIVNYKGIIKKYIERNFGGFEIIIDFEKNYHELQELEQYNQQIYTDFFSKITEREKWSSIQIFEIVFNIYCSINEEPDSVLEETSLDDVNYIQNIIDNINDIKSRYLLLGIRSSLAPLIQQKISKELKKTIYFYEGSPFENDNDNEYQFRVINKIQEHAERGDIIILQNLNQVYAFLYDLFNKNFIKKDGKEYARICQGNYSDQLTPINKTFRIIIMVNKKYMDKVEPPFLNRFEKMLISFYQLISENQKKFAKIIENELDIKKYENKYKITYRLKNLLIGCHSEDILGMIYYELDSNEKGIKDENKIKENIFNKLYKLMPQDIIVNLDDENEIKKIYNEKKEYNNLEQYLKSNPKHKISIIYTFNSINTRINDIDESSSFKMISEIKSENQLLGNINNMISENTNIKTKNKNEKKNIIFIQLDESNSNKIGFLILFVINNYYKNEELKFIFIIHVKRNFYVDEKAEKIFAVPDINYNIYQLFIDNLIGPNIKLNEIINDLVQKLLDEDLVKIEDEFNNALKEFTKDNLKNLYGDNDKINKDNYLEKLETYFDNEDNKDIKKSIIDKIKSYIDNQKENSNSIIENIYKSKYINKDTVDLISIIIDYVKKEVISKNIKRILCKLEDNNILTTLLVLNSNKNLINDKLKETIGEMINQYIIDKINIEDDKYEPKFILSYIIPCFYDSYIKISNFVAQNIRNDFFKNEKIIRNFSSDKKNKDDTLENYYKKEEYLLSLTYNELEKNKFLFDFANTINEIKTDLILNDYITYFLVKYGSNDGDLKNMLNYLNLSYNDSKHKLILLLLDLRFDDKKRIIENNQSNLLKLVIKINWLESNKDYIIKILNIYDILKNIFEENEYIKIIESTLNEEKLRYITHEKKNPEITTEVNECFYKILASFCYSIIPPYIDFKKQIGSNNYIDCLINAMKIIKSLNDDLSIYSIEVDLIEELIQIYEVLSLNEKLDKEKLTNICMAIKKNNSILQMNKEIQSDKLIEEFKNFISELNKAINYEDKKYFELLKFIFFKEIRKVPNVSYRTAIFQEVIKDPEVLINSNDILQILLFPLVKPRKDFFPKSISEILSSTDYDVAVIIENILENESGEDKIYNALSETLLYYFEKNSLMYFHDIFHGKEKILFENDDDEDKKSKDEEKKTNDEDKKIKLEKKISKAEEKKIKKSTGPLKLFTKCIKYLIDYNKGNDKLDGKNKNFCKLFCLGYIRAYCYTFIDLIDSGSSNLESPTKIINEINNSKIFSKMISFYVWKVIYNKNKKNFDIFLNPEYIIKYNLKDYKCFQNVEINESPFTYDYINPQDQDINDEFNQFNQILEKYKDKKFEEVNLEEFKMNKQNIDVFYFSTNILILSRLKQKQFIESQIYKNFFKNVCTPLFKNNDKIFSAIKILYDPEKYLKFKNAFGITQDNLNIVLHSYRYFINELYSKSQNSIYSVFYGRHVDLKKLNNNCYPGNDIKNIPIYSLYSKIVEHFNNIPNQGCFVCLCKGGCYHSIKGGIPKEKYLNLKCKKCGKNIGAIINERGFITPVKRDYYYRIFKTEEEAEKDEKINGEKYNCMSLDEFKKYIIKEFEEEKGIQKNDEDFFKKDTKIIRSLSQISYRILNFILYSHLLFSKVYNNIDSLDKCLPGKMGWIEVITECWAMIKNELNKLGINSIDIFMNYIFSDLFSSLNKHKSLNNYNELDEFERNLEEIIQKSIISFKENYKSFNKSLNEKYSFQNFIEERYNKVNKDEYPFYNYFYYSDYINEAYLINKLKYFEKDRYPVLLKILDNISNNTENLYSLDNLPNFNEILNLFNEKYSLLIKRDKANTLQLKDLKNEEIYNNNRDGIKTFINFYNSLPSDNIKKEKLTLSENSKLADFFIDDNNEFGKSYKKIYAKFIKEQNEEISDLLDKKIEKGIFERNCKNEINIQSCSSNEVFITNLPEKFSFAEVTFNCSYRKIALDKDYNSYNQFEVKYELIEDKMTELLLRNKKLFNESIINFVYSNEKLEFENKNIITEFNRLYEIKDINIEDKKILYQFYQKNKEKSDEFFINILNEFNQLIIFLNNNKKSLNEENSNALILKNDSRIIEALEKSSKSSDIFMNLFKEKDSLIISKVTFLFGYYRDLIFGKIKQGLKAFQNDLENEQKELIKNSFLGKL